VESLRPRTAACHAAFVRGAVPAADDDHRAPGSHFRHPRRRRGLQVFTRELGCPMPRRAAGQAVRLPREALLYVPRGLPLDPEHPAFTQAVSRRRCPFSRRVRARVPALHQAAGAAARARAAGSRIGFPLLVRGRIAAASCCRASARSNACSSAPVLLGSVDVRASALRVVIDKLPSLRRTIPCWPRASRDTRRGGNPFTELQLPQAVLQLSKAPALDPRRDRPRHPDASAIAPGGAPYGPAHPAQPAAHETYGRCGVEGSSATTSPDERVRLA